MRRAAVGISTNPQRSSSQQDTSQSLEAKPKSKENLAVVVPVGNCAKVVIPSETIELSGDLCGKASGYPRKSGKACRRQVYADIECAESTARGLRPLGIIATPEKCSSCGLIHIHEYRVPDAR